MMSNYSTLYGIFSAARPQGHRLVQDPRGAQLSAVAVRGATIIIIIMCISTSTSISTSVNDYYYCYYNKCNNTINSDNDKKKRRAPSAAS